MSDAGVVAAAWTDSLVRVGGEHSAAARSAADLVRRYSAERRRYHSLRHVAAVLQDAAWLAGEVDLDDEARALLALAACAHDVVYDARPGEDERASAAWAADAVLAAGGPGEVAERVAGLVLATIEHTAGVDDTAAGVLLDADLAILGTTPDLYAEYVAAVRLEYASVPDDAWRAGRGEVLSGLLGREPLYVNRAARERWDAPARANVGAELARLGADSALDRLTQPSSD